MALDWAEFDTGDEGVHRLRVTIRREQARLRACRAAVPGRQRRRAKRVWRAVMRAAGRVRDVDIALALAHEAGLLADLETRLVRRRQKRAAKLAKLLAEVERPAIEWPAMAPEASSVEPVLRRFFRAGRRVAERPDVRRLHALRLAGKRLRYLLELLPASGEVKKGLKQLKRLQDALGAINDCVTAAALHEHDAFHRWLEVEIERRRADFRRVWDEGFTSRERWYALFGIVPEGPQRGSG